MKLDLQRYNRIVWAVNGSLLLVGALALLAGGLASFWPSSDRGQSLPAGTPSPSHASAPAAVLRLGLPKPLRGTGALLVPVEGLPREDDEPRGIGSYSKGAPDAPLFNLLFVDAKTQASRPLLTRKSLILRYDILEDREDAKDAQTLGLLVRVVDTDTNQNGRLDAGDDSQVCLCDPLGRDLRVITPPGTACDNWQFDSARRMVYLLVGPRGESRASGSTEVLMASLDGAQPAHPLVPKAQVDDLRAMLQR